MSTKDFLALCKSRGYVHQCTDEADLSALFQQEMVTAYIGFDCTARSLHVGSLLQIMMLRHLQKCGHKPIVLMGGGTTKVGDPSGKDHSRQMLSDEQIAENMAGIKQVFEKFLEFETEEERYSREHTGVESGNLASGNTQETDKIPACAGMTNNKAIMVNNDDWLKHINMYQYLRDISRFFSVNRMMTMESVKQRLGRESHLSMMEFNYMILQAYDFVHLNEHFGCRLQMGGSDQWGNIVMGADLHHKLHFSSENFVSYDSGNEEEDEKWNEKYYIKKKKLFGLTSPLITTASGAKMGKTASGAIWLNADMLSPYDYWQFWRNSEDADVGRFLRLFTELELDEIAELEALEGAKINEAKIRLANEATALLHGEAAAQEAAETAKKVFEQGGVGESLPEFVIPELVDGLPVFKLLQDAGLAKSGKEARQKIREKAVKVNDITIEDENRSIGINDLTADGFIKLSVGKKRHALVKAA